MSAGNAQYTAYQVGVDTVSLRGLLLYCVHKLTFYELEKWNVDMKKLMAVSKHLPYGVMNFDSA